MDIRKKDTCLCSCRKACTGKGKNKNDAGSGNYRFTSPLYRNYFVNMT